MWVDSHTRQGNMVKEWTGSNKISLFLTRRLLLTTSVNHATAIHVTKEMPFSCGCHDTVAEPVEAAGRLTDVRWACQAASVPSIRRQAASVTQSSDQLKEHRNLCLVPDREDSWAMWESRAEHLCVLLSTSPTLSFCSSAEKHANEWRTAVLL